ncbi:MAG: hypothetical protein WBH69_04930, partial [Fervidobacterium sp.]
MEITQLYEILRSIHGPHGKWWPGSVEEVLISAVLTQNTSWANVEKALDKIRIRFLSDSNGFNG